MCFVPAGLERIQTAVHATASGVSNRQRNGVDVSGLSLVTLNHIPGNVLKGNWRTESQIQQEKQEAMNKLIAYPIKNEIKPSQKVL